MYRSHIIPHPLNCEAMKVAYCCHFAFVHFTINRCLKWRSSIWEGHIGYYGRHGCFLFAKYSNIKRSGGASIHIVHNIIASQHILLLFLLCWLCYACMHCEQGKCGHFFFLCLFRREIDFAQIASNKYVLPIQKWPMFDSSSTQMETHVQKAYNTGKNMMKMQKKNYNKNDGK